jgi:hypothetical protein
VVFIDKRAGEIREEFHRPNFQKVSEMKPIPAPEDESAAVRRFRVYRDERLAMELRDAPGILVSTSTPPPPPGTPPVMHAFSGAVFYLAEYEGELGLWLRTAADLDSFLERVDAAGYTIEPFGESSRAAQVTSFDPASDDAELVAFARQGRIVPFPSRDAVLRIGDMELLYEIFERGGRYELTLTERSAAPRWIMSSESLAVVRAYLIKAIGVNVRAHLRLRRVVLPIVSSALPAGFTLDETDSAGVELSWVDDGVPRSARFRAGGSGVRDAVQLAHYVPAPEHELIEALLHPSGRPLFRVG